LILLTTKTTTEKKKKKKKKKKRVSVRRCLLPFLRFFLSFGLRRELCSEFFFFFKLQKINIKSALLRVSMLALFLNVLASLLT